MADPEIRQATTDDLPALQAIAEAAYAKYVSRIGRRPPPMDADFADHVGRGETHVLEIDGAVAGYVVAYPETGSFLVRNIAVAPEFQNRGLGRTLLDFAEGLARARGEERVTLYTNVKMTENLDFYPYLGYAETHRAREGAFERVYFEKRLAP